MRLARTKALVATLLVALAATSVARAGGVVEKFDDGKVKRRYTTDEKGRKTGAYLENHENGKPRIKASYVADELDGAYAELHENGKPKVQASYKRGLLHGRFTEHDESGRVTRELVYFEGKLAYPKTAAQIVKRLAAIAAEPIPPPQSPAGRPKVADVSDVTLQVRALRKLRAYRYLCDVPEDVQLGADEADACAAGARLLADYIGRLEHRPERPAGIPDALWELGFKGTSGSNLHENGDLVAAVDEFLWDSDRSNIADVGHRRWSLNPPMKVTAFGQKGKFVAMWATDKSRQEESLPDVVPYPARGYFPTTHIRADAAWSVSLSASRFQAPATSGVKVLVSPADDRLRKGPPVPISDLNVSPRDFGLPICVIFRPTAPVSPGARYWVEVKGVKDREGADAPIEYLVEFFKP